MLQSYFKKPLPRLYLSRWWTKQLCVAVTMILLHRDNTEIFRQRLTVPISFLQEVPFSTSSVPAAPEHLRAHWRKISPAGCLPGPRAQLHVLLPSTPTGFPQGAISTLSPRNLGRARQVWEVPGQVHTEEHRQLQAQLPKHSLPGVHSEGTIRDAQLTALQRAHESCHFTSTHSVRLDHYR